MNSYLSLFVFLIITLTYFWLVKINVPFMGNMKEDEYEKKYLETYNSNIYRLLFYFFIVVITQVILNVIYVSQLCGGSVSQNIGVGSLLAFIPWVFIFGVVIIMLLLFPGLKMVFSNVIGYFAISWKANNILNDILIDTNMDEKISKISSNDDKTKIKKVADMIVKLVSNKSLLINEFNPLNFNKMWNIINPLLKEDKKNDLQTKEDFFQLVIMKDNIGEMMWYIYTAVFLVSVVSYNTISRGCSKSLNVMKNNLNDYEEKSKQITKTPTSTSQIYNIS